MLGFVAFVGILVAQLPKMDDGPETVIAVGQGFLSGLMVTIFSAIGSIFLGLVLAVAVVQGVYLMRRRMAG